MEILNVNTIAFFQRALWLAILSVVGFITPDRPSYASSEQALIIDNGAPGTRQIGEWFTRSDGKPYQSNAHCSQSIGASYSYRFSLPKAAQYDVYMWWPQHEQGNENVPVNIRHENGKDNVRINQRQNGGTWWHIGAWPFDRRGRLTIFSDSNELTTCADAIKLVPATAATLAKSTQTATLTLSWQAPATNRDGTALENLAGFVVYQSAQPNKTFSKNDIITKLPANPGENTTTYSYTVENLVPKTYYFAVTAYNSAGVESAPSNVVAATIEP